MESSKDQKRVACGEVNSFIDELHSYADILDSKTHNAAEVEKNIDEINQLVDTVVEKAEGTQRSFKKLYEIIKGSK